MTNATWEAVVTTPDRVAEDYPDILHEMADLKYGAVIIRGFYTEEHCREVVDRIEQEPERFVTIKEFVNAEGEEIALRYVGPGLGQYVDDREGFFRESRLADTKFDLLYGGLPDPRVMVREMLGRLLPGRQVIVAHEDGVPYGDAVIRMMLDGDASALHRDSAMTYFKGWMVSQFPTQFSSLVCFQMPEAGGELSVFRRRWSPEDDESRPEGTTGYTESVVAGAGVCTIRPQEGDLYIFHPEVFHDIAPSHGSRARINQGIFIAISPRDSRVVTWG